MIRTLDLPFGPSAIYRLDFENLHQPRHATFNAMQQPRHATFNAWLCISRVQATANATQ
jgi:hypothetical protein